MWCPRSALRSVAASAALHRTSLSYQLSLKMVPGRDEAVGATVNRPKREPIAAAMHHSEAHSSERGHTHKLTGWARAALITLRSNGDLNKASPIELRQSDLRMECHLRRPGQ